MEEIWKDIEGYEGLYQVSSTGKVFSFPRAKTKGGYKKITKDKDGYCIVTLSKEGKHKTTRVHRLVAQAFIKNSESKLEVNHIDGNKTNNNVFNLEWCNPKENNIHAWKNGLKKMTNQTKEKISQGSINKTKIIQLDRNKKIVAIYESIVEASTITHIGVTNISACCRNYKGQKTAGGYIWKYKE